MISEDTVIVLYSVLTSGLLMGVLFAVAAAGLTLIHGTILLPQATNGQFFLLGGLLFWLFGTHMEWPVWLALSATFAGILLAAALLEATVIRRFYGDPNRSATYLILTLGVAQIITGVLSGTFGKISETFQVTPPVPGYAIIDPFPVSNGRLLAFLLSIGLLAGLIVFLRFNRLGRAMRALFQNREVARLRGVNMEKTYRFAFLLGTVIAGAGGILYSLAFALDMSLGWTMSLITFSIMIVGGPGSVFGALCVSLVFGFTQAVVSVFTDPTIATFAYLLAMLAILLFRPSGLFLR